MFSVSAADHTSIYDRQHTQSLLVHALSSYENFMQYLDADREIQTLAMKAKQSPSIPLAYHRWSIAWLKN